MPHLWMRAETRPHEARSGLTPGGAARLIAQGFRLTVEDSRQRALPPEAYGAAGCEIAPEGAWPDAPRDAVILGLKELPEADTPLVHRHVMFGHAYKGQSAGRRLLDRFKAGGGTLLDLEYLVEPSGRRVAAFGYWAGFAGAAVSVIAWTAQRDGGICPAVDAYPDAGAMTRDLSARLGADRPAAMVIGALGRVGTGASDLCERLGLPVTRWDLAETSSREAFPEVLDHPLFFNCILARPGAPVFVPENARQADRRLRVIGDIACDPQSDFSPVKVYDRETSWEAPVVRAWDTPPLDVMAIDNLPSLLPRESSEDFAAQLLPHLAALESDDAGVWARAEATFRDHL